MERERGLETSIPKTNVGHKLLAAMGYKDGEGIGKHKEGIVVPLTADVKTGRGGLGRASQVLEQQRAAMERTLEQANAHVRHFRSNKRGDMLLRQLERDLPTAVRLCESLDRRKGITDNELWANKSEVHEESGKITDSPEGIRSREERMEEV